MIQRIAMSRFLLCSLMAVILGSAGPVRADDAKKDEDKLQGTRQATEAVADGKPVPKEELACMKVVFAGDKMRIPPRPMGTARSRWRTRSGWTRARSRRPSTPTPLRGGGKGKTALGIYELDGDTVKLCLPVRLDKERPTEFAAPEKSGLVLLTLKRVKKSRCRVPNSKFGGADSSYPQCGGSHEIVLVYAPDS